MTNNILTLEERVLCGKIKSKAKTLLIGEFNNDNENNNNDNDNDNKNNTNKINTIKLLNIQIQFGGSDNNVEFVKSLLVDTSIIISTESNPKSSNSHILVFPGYLANIIKISENILEVDILIKNFFPSNIPLNQTKLYFMIWFKKIIPTNLIIKTTINYEFDKLELTDSNLITLEEIKNMIVQQTQTFNVISNGKSSDIIAKKCPFENLCRGFWIKMFLSDYNNLKKIKLQLNGHDRLELTIYQIELMGIIKFIEHNSILIFINLEFENINTDWSICLSHINTISIYSNTLNCTRIDTINFLFQFNTKYVNSDIKITALSLNLLNIQNNTIKYKYF
jgi:hypothetical protein